MLLSNLSVVYRQSVLGAEVPQFSTLPAFHPPSPVQEVSSSRVHPSVCSSFTRPPQNQQNQPEVKEHRDSFGCLLWKQQNLNPSTQPEPYNRTWTLQ